MRARNIKKEFWENEEVAECDPIARLLFIGLWCYADKEGLFEWRPKRIKALIFPYDGFKIDKYLDELLDEKLIEKYTADGKEYGNVINFKKHQRPHPHEAKSKLPKPPLQIPEKAESLQGENNQLNQCDDMSLHCNTNEEPTPTNVSECKSDTLIPDTLIPDTRNPDTLIPDTSITSNLTFEDWWKIYPKKKGKQNSLKEWKKLKPDQNLILKMCVSLHNHKKSKDWIKEGGQYIPYPERWIKNRRWEDETEVEIESMPYSETTAKNLEMFKNWNPEE